MNGVQIEYLLGLYFIVVALSWDNTNRRLNRDVVKLIAGILLVAAAFLGKALI